MSLLDEVRKLGYSTPPVFDEPVILAWKKTLVETMCELPKRPAWPGAPHGLSRQRAEELVNTLTEELEQIEALLQERYGVPHLYNVKDPLAELLLIMLSRKTPEDAYLRAFDRLLDGHDSWEEVHQMEEEELLATVQDGGLASKKAAAIKSMLDDVFELSGEYSLDGLHEKSDEEVFTFLSSLEEVGPKSTLCVMMYALERPAFPVDAHVGRLMQRLGVFETIGLELEPMDHKQKQKHLTNLVPPHLRYSLHVNALMLGRELCPARKPQCEKCPLASCCKTGRAQVMQPAV